MTKTNEIMIDILHELGKAKQQYPEWPDDLTQCVAIMAEKSDESVSAEYNHTYHKEPIDSLKKPTYFYYPKCG